MNSTEKPVLGYSKEEIDQQLQRICADPIFAVSDILMRFLSFIVEETLLGRSNQIKEYTIGMNVLNKPGSFNPSLDAIVRIHAGRLRRALHQYYEVNGKNDPIRILMPKGNYVPVFSPNAKDDIAEFIESKHEDILKGESVSSDPGNFMFTGDMQVVEDRLRIRIQMMNIETHKELWSQMVEYNLHGPNGFDIQDEISKKLITAVGDYYRFIKEQVGPSSIMSVA